MNTLLLEHFDELISTPEDVEKVNRSILQLAMQGKLVEQDPQDEPASETLKGILKAKEETNLPGIDEDTKVFELPGSWEWTTLGFISENIHYGYTASADFTLKEYRLLRITDIQDSRVHWEDVPGCAITDEEAQKYLIKNGDILIARTGGTIGKSYLVANIKVKAVFASYLIRVLLSKEVSPEYVKLFLDSPLYWKQLMEKSKGTGQPNVNATSLSQLVLGLPPLAEQQRIVARAEELFAQTRLLAEQLSHSRTELDRLNESALAHLLASETHEEFNERWSFIAEHFDLLTSAPEHIAPLRQSILELAVRGKLTQREAGDEPAKELIRRIKEEKAQLIEEGKLKKEKPLPSIKENEKPFELPEGWEWAHVGDISKSSEYGTSEKASDLDEIPVLRMNNIQNGNVLLENLKYVSSSIFDLPKLYLNTNDLLFNRTNSYELVGKTGVFKGESKKYTFASYLIRVSFFQEFSNIEFINDYFNSRSCRITQIEPHITQQTGQANFNGTKLMNIVVPIPPLAEQERIVKRVEQLLGWCDALEAQLQSAEEERGMLVESVLARVGVGS